MEQSFAGEELERFVGRVMAAFPDLTLRVLRRIPAGAFVVVEWEIGGTHLGEFLGAAPTGEYALVRGCDIAAFAPDGSIRSNHVYWDSATVARQIGVGQGQR
jgi:predicted ester cyclase